MGRIRPPRRHSPCILPHSTRANQSTQDQLDIANFLRVGTHLREALSRVLDYAYWRTKKRNPNAVVLFYDQPVHPPFSGYHLCLCPVQTGDEALELSRATRKVLDATDPDGVGNYLWKYVGHNPLKKAPVLRCTTGYSAFLDIALAVIPVSVIWSLQLPRHKKVNLSLVMSVGIL